jgi:hypothetical protein
MKKTVIAVVLVAVVAVALGSAGYVYAQTSTPPAPGTSTGPGLMMRGRGMMQGFRGTDGYGPMHDEMVAAMADKLGVTVDQLNTELNGGKTMWQIAEEKGLTQEQFTQLMKDARTQALDEAVKNGDLTQEQADWMKQRMNGTTGFGRGGCMGNGGGRGFGRGGMMNR